MAPTVKTEPNEYEAQRAANIAKNQALLRDLQLDAAKAGLGLSKPAVRATSTSSAASDRSSRRKKASVKKEPTEVVPRRTSSRLAGLSADSPGAKRKAEEEAAALQEAARAKCRRVGGELDLSQIVVAGRDWDARENFLANVVVGGAGARAGAKYERTFTQRDVEETGDKGLKELREQMSGLKLYEGFVPNKLKITPERIYSLAFHPTRDKPLVFAGDKLGNLGVFDGSQTIPAGGKADPDEDEQESAGDDGPAITTFKLHARTISAFLFPDGGSSHGNTLLSASYDSSIRALDLCTSKSVELYAPPEGEDDDPITAIDVPQDSPSIIYFSTMAGFVGRHDTRVPPNKHHPTQHYQLSDKKIGGFSLHPTRPHLLSTASLDRTLKIWDLRNLASIDDDSTAAVATVDMAPQPLLVGAHESRLSVSHAVWNSAGQIVTSSYDDTIKIYDFPAASGGGGTLGGSEEEDIAIEPTTVVPHNNQTGRWVTILRPQWQLHPSQPAQQKFCIGNMSRFVDVYSAAGHQLAQLGGGDDALVITAVPAVAQFHPSNDWVAGGTASGKLCLWL